MISVRQREDDEHLSDHVYDDLASSGALGLYTSKLLVNGGTAQYIDTGEMHTVMIIVPLLLLIKGFF